MSPGIPAMPLHLSCGGRTNHILDGWFSCVTSLCREHPPIHHALTPHCLIAHPMQVHSVLLRSPQQYLYSHTPSISVRYFSSAGKPSAQKSALTISRKLTKLFFFFLFFLFSPQLKTLLSMTLKLSCDWHPCWAFVSSFFFCFLAMKGLHEQWLL